jgi:hypothetical protein
MRTFPFPLLLCSLLYVYAPAASAASQMKQGLWEMKMKSDAMKNIPTIPPEQIEQMRKMGMEIPQMDDGAMVTQVCVTKEMAEDKSMPGMNQHDAGCEAKNHRRSGNSFSTDIVCDGPQVKGQGKAKGTFSSREGFTSTYDFKGTMAGRPVDQHHETVGKWLKADCGSVKPDTEMVPRK